MSFASAVMPQRGARRFVLQGAPPGSHLRFLLEHTHEADEAVSPEFSVMLEEACDEKAPEHTRPSRRVRSDDGRAGRREGVRSNLTLRRESGRLRCMRGVTCGRAGAHLERGGFRGTVK